MKAISLWQPWASLIAVGAKTIETRSWETFYRGPLAIHAGKRIIKSLQVTEPEAVSFANALAKAGCRSWMEFDGLAIEPGKLPLGCVVATCELADCIRVPEYRLNHWLYQDPKGIVIPPPAPELHFGDYRPGRYAWILKSIVALSEPIPATGRQQLFDWTPPADRGAS